MAAARSFRKHNPVWRRLAPANALRVLAICAVFVVLPLLAIYFSRELQAPANMKGITGLGGVPGRGEPSFGLSVELDSNDPVVRFSETRVGHILFSPYVGDNCRRVLFHNQTGALVEGRPASCMTTVQESAASSSADRLMALRKSFQK